MFMEIFLYFFSYYFLILSCPFLSEKQLLSMLDKLTSSGGNLKLAHPYAEDL